MQLAEAATGIAAGYQGAYLEARVTVEQPEQLTARVAARADDGGPDTHAGQGTA
jgi:hypothetical protein